MSVHPGEPVLRSNPEVQQQRLPWALLLLTLAAITSWSLSVISLYHILTLKAEVAGLRAELGRRREEQRSMSVQRQGGPSQEPQTSKAKEVRLEPPSSKMSRKASGNSLPELHLTYNRKKRGVTQTSEEKVLQPCLQMMANSKKETTFQDEHTVIPWQVGLRRGTALEESNNTILVKEEGFYFVYSQVYYTDKTFAMGHFVIRRKQNVVGDELQEVILFRCIQTMNPIFPYNTCYTAGVVKLEVGDRVELLIPRQSANVSLDGDSTFLGAIKLV
ncbi:tumor necrosis factor ligand superfamily member 13B-like [Scleropages formosus]|uniref:tumor necrosis factor ligand superfamily member 13B-like n=1 Tax=Scleropages formosus TaxID=113540 RepID=UPI0010FA75D3|nr:tumor necrosis factor ligand superfamily member 13B-like [Scleropages formosus]